MYTCDPGLELDGHTALSLVSGINADTFTDILAAHQLDKIDPQGWYPVQDVLDVFNDLEQRIGSAFDLLSVGLAVPVVKPFPQDKKPTLSQFLLAYNERYRRSHRNGDPGQIEAQQIDENYFILKAQVPYPDDMMYGLFYGYTRELRPVGKPFSVKYDETHLRKGKGGASTIYLVRWDR